MHYRAPKLYYKYIKIESKKTRSFYKRVYHLFQKPYLKVTIPLLFTTAVGLEIQLIATNVIWLVIAITLLFYSFYLWVTVLFDNYNKSIIINTRLINEVLSQMSTLFGSIAHHKIETINTISKSPKYVPTIKDFQLINFQEISLKVCSCVYNLLKHSTGEEDFHITLYTKFSTKKGKRKYIKMIAFANKRTKSPAGIADMYYLDEYPKDRNGEKIKDYYHKEIFRKNANSIIVLENSNEVMKFFKINPKNEDREKNIKQYIAIPVYCDDEGIVALLQIDTNEDCLLGNNKVELENIGIQLTPIAQLLLINYYRDCLIKCFSKKFEIFGNEKK